jgi:hypothetical protein
MRTDHSAGLIMAKYAETLGDGHTFDVAHNLGTRDVIVQVAWMNGTVLPAPNVSSIVITDENTIRIVCNNAMGARPASKDSLRVVVLG